VEGICKDDALAQGHVQRLKGGRHVREHLS
jgi:hypothetical protein